MSTGLLNIIKQASMDANNASNPTNLIYGTVTSASPLEITVTSNFKLPSALLIVPERLTDHSVQMTVDMTQKTMTYHNGLRVGDRVVLIREQGGRKYFVLDRF